MIPGNKKMSQILAWLKSLDDREERKEEPEAQPTSHAYLSERAWAIMERQDNAKADG